MTAGTFADGVPGGVPDAAAALDLLHKQ